MKLYYLEHLMVYHDYEDTKFIGIFTSREKALNTINFLSDKNGFKYAKNLVNPITDDNKSGFVLEEMEVDTFSWKEGFGV